MKNVLFLLVVATLMVATNGCANGPLRSLFRGAPCNSCNPPLGQAFGHGWGGSKMANCSNGVCTTPSDTLGQLPAATEPYTTAKNPSDQYPYPGGENSTLGGLAPIGPDTTSGQIWQQNQPPVGSGAGGSLNGYVNPPSIGPLPSPRGN